MNTLTTIALHLTTPTTAYSGPSDESVIPAELRDILTLWSGLSAGVQMDCDEECSTAIEIDLLAEIEPTLGEEQMCQSFGLALLELAEAA